MARDTVRGVPTDHPDSLVRALHRQYNILIDEIDRIRRGVTGTGLLTAVDLEMGSTDRQIASDEFNFQINGRDYNRAAVAAGTAIGAQTVPSDQWAIYRLSIDAAGTIAIAAGAANATTGYDTEAEAIEALPATPANQADMGYVTVKTATGVAWVAATDALEGGASGNPASVTNYYPAPVVIGDDAASRITL